MADDNSDESITQSIEDNSNKGEEKGGKEVEEKEAPTDNDVLLGRGGNGFKHKGNQKLRSLSNNYIYSYNSVKKSEKALVAKAVYDQVKAMDPPGRFLKRKPGSHTDWVEVSEETGIEKVSQVLRDLRRQFLLKDRGGSRIEMCSSGGMMMQMQGSPTLYQHQEQDTQSFINDCAGNLPQPSPHEQFHDLRSHLASCDCLPPRVALLNSAECYYNGTVLYNLHCSRCHRHYEGQMTYVNGVVDKQSTTFREKRNYSFLGVPHHSNNFSGAQMDIIGGIDTNQNRELMFKKRKYDEQNVQFQDVEREDPNGISKSRFFFNGDNNKGQYSASNSYY